MKDSAPLWTRNFILASTINFQLILVFYLLIVVIVGYAVAELGASTAQAGLISGLYIVGTLFGRLLIGKFLSRFGHRLTLLTGLSGFFLFSGLYFIEYGIGFLLFVRAIHGFTMGVASTVLGTLIAQILPVSRRGEGIGYYSMSSTLGTAIGPFLGIWLSLNFDYNVIFIFSSIIAFCCLFTALGIKMPNLVSRQETATASPPKSSWITQFIEPRAVPIAIIILLTSVCYSGVLSFINFYAKTLDLAKAASIFFLMYALAILFSRPFTGPLVDRRGENIIMYPAILILAFGLFLLSQVQTASMLLICAGLLGLGFGNIQSVCQTIAVKSTSLERMGLATSTFFIFLDAGLGFGPYILGKLLEYINYSQLYFISSLLALICVVLYYLLHGRKVRAPFKTVNL